MKPPLHLNPPDVIERLVNDNLGLAYHLARIMSLHSHDRRDRSEIEAVALEALFSAARRYEFREAKFGTYAFVAIVRRVGRYRRREARFRCRHGLHNNKPWKRRLRLFSELGDSYVGGNANLFAYLPSDKPIDHPRLDLALKFVAELSAKRRHCVEQVLMGRTGKDVGEDLGISSSRVHQLVSDSIYKMRAKARRV